MFYVWTVYICVDSEWCDQYNEIQTNIHHCIITNHYRSLIHRHWSMLNYNNTGTTDHTPLYIVADNYIDD
jgi:hypothetical protein